MPIQLPKIKRNKVIYFFDEKLNQLRNIDNPHDYIELTAEETDYYKDVAEGRFATKNLYLVEASKEF
mgnify:CR=1 FL=1